MFDDTIELSSDKRCVYCHRTVKDLEYHGDNGIRPCATLGVMSSTSCNKTKVVCSECYELLSTEMLERTIDTKNIAVTFKEVCQQCERVVRKRMRDRIRLYSVSAAFRDNWDGIYTRTRTELSDAKGDDIPALPRSELQRIVDECNNVEYTDKFGVKYTAKVRCYTDGVAPDEVLARLGVPAMLQHAKRIQDLANRFTGTWFTMAIVTITVYQHADDNQSHKYLLKDEHTNTVIDVISEHLLLTVVQDDIDHPDENQNDGTFTID